MTDDWTLADPNSRSPLGGEQPSGVGPISDVQADVQASDRHLNAVLETMALAGLVVDANGDILLCNDYLLTLTGWQRQDVMGRSWSELFIPTDQRQALKAMFAAAIAQGQCPAYHENRDSDPQRRSSA
jgi:PAS domain S-box-containing protein